MVNVLGSKIIFVSTFEAAQDLFTNRSKDYSERPHQVLVGDLYGRTASSRASFALTVDRMGWKFALTLTSLTHPAFHTFRRVFVREFSSHAVNAYRDVITVRHRLVPYWHQ